MLKLEHISKTYPGVVALYDVSLEYEQGEVHALLGENGAGKSTLIKIIAGAIEPDAGGIIDFDGKKFTHMTPALSAQNGVAVIYQDINLVTPMTVAENIFMGRKMGKVYSKRRLNALARELFAEYGFNLLFVVQTDIHIFLDDRQPKPNGFQPLAIGLTLRVDLNFRDQFLNQLPFLSVIHLSIELIEVDQNLVDIITSQLFCLNSLFLGSGCNQQRFQFFNLIIHPIEPIIKV